mmetsp:Transcript_5033/g.3687  ORF Transcript_5033/g.3687 Transcript_5033/m.3687 type:complete len:88 (-) Transcript_5033:1322-1585(-)
MESLLTPEIFDYQSTLFKQVTTVRESLLQILYHYRNRWTMYILLCLNCLFRVAFYDPQRLLLRYLQTMDPPTYEYGRYIDWIEPQLA